MLYIYIPVCSNSIDCPPEFSPDINHEQDWAEVIITPGGKCDKVIKGLVSHENS